MGNEHEQRIADLEKQMAILEHELSDIKENQTVQINQLANLVTRCTSAIWGHNGEAGLAMEVDRIKQLAIDEQLAAIRITQSEHAIKMARWAGGLAFAVFLAPILVKILWP